MTQAAQNNRQGMLWMLLWAVSFTTSVTLTKLMCDCLATEILVFMRLTMGLLLFLPIYASQEGARLPPTKKLPFHALQATLMVSSMLCTYYAYGRLPLALATSIGFTGPLMTAILSALILHEKIKPRQWGLIALGYTGVLVVVRPGILEVDLAVLILLVANLLAAGAVICMKHLTRWDATLTIMFYLNSIAFLLICSLAYVAWETPEWEHLPYLVGIGATGVLSQFSRLRALKLSTPGFLAPLEYTRLVLAIPIGMILFQEHPDLWTYLGTALIMASTLYLALSQNK